MQEHIGLFTYSFYNKYALRQLYHMCMNYFSLHEDHYNLIEYMLRGFVLFASSNLNPLGVFMYIKYLDPYKYAITTSMRCTFSLLETSMTLLYKYSFVSNGLYTFRRLDYKSKNFSFY